MVFSQIKCPNIFSRIFMLDNVRFTYDLVVHVCRTFIQRTVR